MMLKLFKCWLTSNIFGIEPLKYRYMSSFPARVRLQKKQTLLICVKDLPNDVALAATWGGVSFKMSDFEESNYFSSGWNHIYRNFKCKTIFPTYVLSRIYSIPDWTADVANQWSGVRLFTVIYLSYIEATAHWRGVHLLSSAAST